MKIFCLIAFVFLATSFTTNNENFKNISKCETLEIGKTTEEYRVTAFVRGDVTERWLKQVIKIRVTRYSDRIMMTEVAYYALGHWFSDNGYKTVFKTTVAADGEEATSKFKYNSGGWRGCYFNLEL